MISWICRDSAFTHDADAYHAQLLRTRVAQWRAQPGNRAVHVFRRPEGERTQFLILTFWESREALRAGVSSTEQPPTPDHAVSA